MQIQQGIFTVDRAEYPRVLEVWEASLRATHHFVREEDIEIFRPLVLAGLEHVQLAGLRDESGMLAGFIGAAGGMIEMLFLHPQARGQGGGARLLRHAITAFDATRLDVNEQNEAALGFYLRMGFVAVGRSERDGQGKPYPLLHMQYAGETLSS